MCHLRTPLSLKSICSLTPSITLYMVYLSVRPSGDFIWYQFLCVTTSFAYDIVDIIAAFIHGGPSPGTDKKHPWSSGVLYQLSSPRWEITAVCFSYLLAASSFYLHFFSPSANLLMKSRSSWKQKATALWTQGGSCRWSSEVKINK